MIKHTFLLFFVVTFCLSACKPPPPGNTSTPKTTHLTISTPQCQTGTWTGGASGHADFNNQPDFKLKIKVQTLNSSQQAVLYKNYSYNYSYGANAFADCVVTKDVEVPETGMYVVIVDIEYSECTWQNTNSCSFPTASQKDYSSQQTFNSYTPFASYSSMTKIFDNCVCN